jgi:DHA1 family bicyclomycin/chloramphenicol resistance-like MFS transporter
MLLAGLAMLGPFSINTYLPSFGEMTAALATDQVALQQTIAIYLAAFAFMSLWHGAISDAFGRRRVVLAGLAVYALASFGCALATRVEQLWVLRALQGFSAGAGIVIGRAMVRDLHEGPLAQRMMSQVIMVFSLAPAIAPVIGGWLQVGFGWRAVFVFLGLMAGALFVAVAWRLPETLPRERRQVFAPRALASGYRAVFGNAAFIGWCIAYAFMFNGFFLYVLSAPVFLMQHLGLGETDFLWMFGPATIGLMAGSALAGHVAQRWSGMRTLRCAFLIMALAMPAMLLRGLDCLPARRGMASSVQLFVQTGFNAFIGAVLAPLLWGSLISLAAGAAGLYLLAALSVLAADRLSRRAVEVQAAVKYWPPGGEGGLRCRWRVWPPLCGHAASP